MIPGSTLSWPTKKEQSDSNKSNSIAVEAETTSPESVVTPSTPTPDTEQVPEVVQKSDDSAVSSNDNDTSGSTDQTEESKG